MDTNETPGLKVSHPYVDPTDARYQCEECGASGATNTKLKGEIVHSKRCDSKPQPVALATEIARRAAKARRSELEYLARHVRKYGLTRGRDSDVAECVKLGLLSQSEAMNTDD